MVATHWRPAGAVVAVSAVWSMANLRRLAGAWSDAVPMPLDNRFQAVVIDWVQGALLGRHGLYDMPMFVPTGRALTFSDHLAGIAAALLPLRLAGLTPAAIFNTGLVIGVVTTALAAYVTGVVVTRRRSAGVVAAALYGLGPISWLATMHVNLAWRAGPPLLLAALWALADRRHAAVGRLAAGAARTAERALLAAVVAVVAWQCLVSFFYVPFMAIAGLVAIWARRADLARRGMVSAGLAVAAGIALAGVSYVPYLATRRRYGDYARSLDEAALLRAAPEAVESDNVVWGWLLGEPHVGLGTFQSFPGLLALAVLVALVVWWRHPAIDVRARGAGLAIMLIGAAFAAGPGAGRLHGWLPFGLAFRLVPGFSAIRASGRFTLLALFGLTVLGAVVTAAAAAELERRGARRLVAVGAAVVLLAGAVEGLSTGRHPHAARIATLDRELAAITEPGAVVYLPVAYDALGDFAAQEAILYRATAHGRPIVNGYSGYYPPSAFRFAEQLRALPGPTALGCLAAHDVRFVVVTDAVPLTPWAALVDPAEAGPLELVARDGDEVLYRLPDHISPEPCSLD